MQIVVEANVFLAAGETPFAETLLLWKQKKKHCCLPGADFASPV